MPKHYLKFTAIIFLLSFPFIIKAQVYRNAVMPYWIIYEDETSIQSASKFNIQVKEMTVRSGKSSMRYLYTYDGEGRIVNYSQGKTKKKNKTNGFSIKYTSPGKKLKEKIIYFKNSKPYKTDSLSYNRHDIVTSYFRYDEYGMIRYKDVYTYDSTLIKEHVAYSYRKQTEKTQNKEVYEYEPDRQLKKITYYNRKGKAYKKTVFDCNPLGVDHKISKDSSYKCVKYDTDSLGNKMKITIENLKKTSTKVIQYFNKDNKLVAYKSFDLKKNQPEYFNFYHPETGFVLKTISFRKGKEYWRRETDLDKNNHISEQRWFLKGKPTSVFKFEYGTDGLLARSLGYNKKQKIVRTVNYRYDINK